MNNELAVNKSNQLANITPETIKMLKNTVCDGHNDDQVKVFAMYCQAKGLDMFAREVYSIIRKGKQTFQMGIDGLRSMAQETGAFDGIEVYWCGKDGAWVDAWLKDEQPYAAKAIVWRTDCSKPFVAIAKFSEYKPDEDWMWKKMASNQIAKCAEALAMRKAFPRKLGGMYAPEEMAQMETLNEVKPESKIIPTQRAPKEDVTPESPIQDIDPNDITPQEDDVKEGEIMNQDVLPENRLRTQSKFSGVPCSGCGNKIDNGEWLYKNSNGKWIHERNNKGVPCL